MKVFVTIMLVLTLAAGGWLSWRQYKRKLADSPDARPTASAIVESRDISFAVSAAGDIGPADQVSVRSEINGRIAELPVDIGDKVKKDQLLCRLDDKELVTERDSRLTEIAGARLQIHAAVLNLEKAGRDSERNKELFANKLISQEQFDNDRTQLELMRNSIHIASNALERAQNVLDQVNERLSKTRIRAPFDCTVLTRPVSLGQTVSGAAGFNSGTDIMTIANLNNMIVNAHINQADVTRLKVAQDVEIRVESVPGLTMPGDIERIAPQAVIKNGIKGFAVRINIKNIDVRVRPGMTAIVEIPVASAENVLAVRLAAVFTEEDERYVYVKKPGGDWERRPVTIGISDYSYAEVQSGLAVGEEVALELPPSAAQAAAAKASKGIEPGKAARPGRSSAQTADQGGARTSTASRLAPRRSVL